MSGETIRVSRSVEVPLAEIELRFSRSSGPGGQHAQKASTRAEAVFDVSASSALSDTQKARVIARVGPVLRAVAQDERSQLRNRQLALERLIGELRGRSRRAAPSSDYADEGVTGAPARSQAPAHGDEAAAPTPRRVVTSRRTLCQSCPAIGRDEWRGPCIGRALKELGDQRRVSALRTVSGAKCTGSVVHFTVRGHRNVPAGGHE